MPWLAVLALLLLAGWWFGRPLVVGGHSAAGSPRLAGMPIEEIRVGDRVWVDLPEGLEPEGADEDEVDPATWRKVSLRAVKVDGSSAEIELLRSVDWLIAQQATVGGVVEVAVPECGIDGPVLVLAVEPCPPIRAGPGRVVTATFRHAAASLVDVHVDGLAQPIGATPNHPFWSEDRRAFVRADELALGERLRTLAGPAAVRALVPRPAPTPVYNIEVHADHVYHIADLGVLVHNATKRTCTPAKPKNGETAATAKGRAAHAAHDYGPGFEKEYRLPSGKKPDAVNFSTQEIVELKPNNPRAIRRGEKQVEGYRLELEAEFNVPFTTRVETY